MWRTFATRILIATAMAVSATPTLACDIADDEGKDFFSPIPKREIVSYTPIPSRYMSAMPTILVDGSSSIIQLVSSADIAVVAESRANVPRGSF